MLTVTAINKAKPKNKPYKISDEKGIYLLVQTLGSKLWLFDYRFDAKRKTLALGSYPDLSLSVARDKRDAARKLLANDTDPGETKKAVQASKIEVGANGFEVIAREWASCYFKNKSESHHDRTLRSIEDHLVPLSKQAIEILKTIHPLSDRGEFLFIDGHDPKKPMSEAARNASLKRMGYNTKTEITGHGFRAMARTILHECLNIDPHVIEYQLSHKAPDVLVVAYNRTKFIYQRTLMMQQWADYLFRRIKSRGEVFPINSAA